MIKVEVFTENIKLPYENTKDDYISFVAEKTISLLELKDVKVTFILSDNLYIQKINKEYRNKDYATDVISFPTREEPFPSGDVDFEDIGDIFISFDKAFSQSIEYEVTFKEELKRLIIHGILHLVGYDHERSEADEVIMTEKEELIYSLIKLEE